MNLIKPGNLEQIHSSESDRIGLADIALDFLYMSKKTTGRSMIKSVGEFEQVLSFANKRLF